MYGESAVTASACTCSSIASYKVQQANSDHDEPKAISTIITEKKDKLIDYIEHDMYSIITIKRSDCKFKSKKIETGKIESDHGMWSNLKYKSLQQRESVMNHLQFKKTQENSDLFSNNILHDI